MLGVLVSGGVSGGHLNPAVTVAMATLGKLPWRKVSFSSPSSHSPPSSFKRFPTTWRLSTQPASSLLRLSSSSIGTPWSGENPIDLININRQSLQIPQSVWWESNWPDHWSVISDQHQSPMITITTFCLVRIPTIWLSNDEGHEGIMINFNIFDEWPSVHWLIMNTTSNRRCFSYTVWYDIIW